jgi:excinuclease ABC subunit C
MAIPPKETTRLPHKPGVYKFYNKQSALIYVGKAKDLNKRVRSYFTKGKSHNRKTLKLVSEVDLIDFVITNTEFDALLLENNLIKASQPKYNILLKDDKSFPFVCVTNERFPRVYSTRQLVKAKGSYYGPYTSVVAMKNVMELVRKLYTIRTCKYNLSEKNVANKKYNVCLEYHIGNCLGPCEGLQSESDYREDIKQVISILKGKLGVVRAHFKTKMNEAADRLEFESANEYKEKLNLLEKFQAKSLVVNPKISDVHICTITSEADSSFVNYMKVKNGAIIYSQTVAVKNKIDQNDDEMISSLLWQFINLDKLPDQGIEVISNINITGLPDNIHTSVPKIGDKKKLVALSVTNAFGLKKDKNLQSVKPDRKEKVLQLLQKDLALTVLPRHIECFDNSNLQGTNPVASMVCFKNGKPAKKDYRKFNVKTVEGPDDFASMKEIVGRRYKRLIEEKGEFPDLILIDGGKGQLSAAVAALKELNIYGEVAVAGIAKRLEEIYLPEDIIPVHISKKSPSLKLLQQLRDEAHRFAIKFHRQKRLTAIGTGLEEIRGIGPATATLLLKEFKSLKKIRAASIEELSAVIGSKKASLVFEETKKGPA